MNKKAVKCAKMFDSVNGVVAENVVIFVEDDKITGVVPMAEACLEGCEVIDLSDKFVTPGLIDCHVHLTMDGEPAGNGSEHTTIGAWTLEALKNARKDLMAGFTMLRVCGGRGFADEAVRDAINKGEFWGPRLMTSGYCIGSTGGHADDHYNPYLVDELNTQTIGDGPVDMVKAVRYNIKHGADFIKFMSTGGVMSRGTTVGAQQLNLEEMKAICDTAKMYGVITGTHAHGTSGINDAIRAGVTTIEHGMIMNEESFKLMKEHGTTLIPTLIAAERIVVKGREIGVPEWAVKKAETVFNTATGGFKRCVNDGITVAFGTDSGTPFNFHGKQAYEFELLTRYGMTVEQALTAATRVASEVLRKDAEIGTIEAGKMADIAAFDGDPREDITAMTRCDFVMKGGVVYKKNGAPTIDAM